jgi:hypothetical protein
MNELKAWLDENKKRTKCAGKISDNVAMMNENARNVFVYVTKYE